MHRLHMEQLEAAFLLCLSDFIDLSNLTHQQFQLDITDMLLILDAVAKSKDFIVLREGILKKQKSMILLVTLTQRLPTCFCLSSVCLSYNILL